MLRILEYGGSTELRAPTGARPHAAPGTQTVGQLLLLGVSGPECSAYRYHHSDTSKVDMEARRGPPLGCGGWGEPWDEN